VRAVWVLGLVIFAGCGAPTAPSSLPATPLKLSLAAGGWQTISDPETFPLGNDAGGALTFAFPTAGSMHYLYTASPLTAIRGTLSVSVRVTTVGPVIFNALDPSQCNLPTAVRPFFWANNNAFGDSDRWWSNPRAYPLAAGSATIAVPLKGENFSNVSGQFGNASSEVAFQFEKALLNVTRLGVTFGGGCSFGHGVNISGGSAQFALTDYSIQ